jgi:broad specificity phosphatase PhoE
MTKILLVRHGEVEGIKPPRFRGRADLPLTELGNAQAEATAQRIASQWSPSRLYTSPARRCRATAAPISKACDLDVLVLDDLNDIDYGAWQFRAFEEIKAIQPELFAAWFKTPQFVRFPNGESLQQLLARTADALRLILAQHGDETVVVVGHDSVNRALMLQLLDRPQSGYWSFDQDPCCINELDVEVGIVRPKRINDTAHLAAIQGDFGDRA